MKRTLAALMIAMAIRICSITALAAFSTFVWTEEYRSELYAVEIMDDTDALGSYSPVIDATASGDEEVIVFDTVEDEPATPTDIEEREPIPDEGMNATGNEPSDDADTDVIFITSYDVEFEVVEDGMEPVEALEEDTEPVEEQQEENTEPEQEG